MIVNIIMLFKAIKSCSPFLGHHTKSHAAHASTFMQSQVQSFWLRGFIYQKIIIYPLTKLANGKIWLPFLTLAFPLMYLGCLPIQALNTFFGTCLLSGISLF